MKRALVVLLFGVALHAQTPKFDVASLKLLPEGTRFTRQSGGPGTEDPERFAWPATTLTSLLALSYGVSGDQISGPDWIGSQFCSITANVPAGATREQFQVMLQNLLAERMHMAVHHKTTSVDGYDLVVAKGGPKLKEPAPPDPAKPNYMGGGQFGPDGTTLTSLRSSIPMFLNSVFIQRLRIDTWNGPPATAPIMRVNDKTGLTGTYDITLHYIPSRTTDVPGPDVFTALESQLGLKLEPAKISLDMIVIDHIDKTPVEN